MRFSHFLTALVGGLPFCWATWAHAETPASTAPAGAEPSPAAVVEPRAEDIAEAEDSFHAGDEAFDVQKYQLALQYFRESYALVASPNTRLMIARSLLELGQLDSSYDEYMGLLELPADEERYARTRSIARKERSALLSRLAWLSVDLSQLPEGTLVTIDGKKRQADNELGAVPVTPGRRKVLAETPEGEQALADVHLAAGRQVVVELKLGETVTIDAVDEEPPVESDVREQTGSEPSPPASSPSLRPYAIASGAVGAVGLGLFAAYGSRSRRIYSGLDEDCTDGACPPGSDAEIQSGRRSQTTANIGLAVGLLGAAGAVSLFVLDHRQRQVAFDIGPGRLTLKGWF